MLYNQPYGISDTNAPYTNGNPATGTPGSIPPAASIEYPQREIVNAITAAALTPSNGDLQQLAKAIQSCQLNFKVDTGVANQYAANLTPNPGAYVKGLCAVLQIANTNTGASTVNFNSIGNAQVKRADGSAIQGGDLGAGMFVALLYDGTNFRTVWSSGVAGTPIYLIAPKDIYVNTTTGNDAYDGTSATFVSGVKGPFKTIGRAATECPKFNQNGYTTTVHVGGPSAPGTYNETVTFTAINGSGAIMVVGDNVNATPGVIWNGIISGPAVRAPCIFGGTGSFIIDGFQIAGPTSGFTSNAGHGIVAAGTVGFVEIRKIFFGSVAHSHINCVAGGIQITGPITVMSGAAAAYHLNCSQTSNYTSAQPNPTITFQGSASFSGAFIAASMLAASTVLYSAINNPGGVTGIKYNVATNAVINSGGSGINYYPGNSAGVTASGGQYV